MEKILNFSNITSCFTNCYKYLTRLIILSFVAILTISLYSTLVYSQIYTQQPHSQNTSQQLYSQVTTQSISKSNNSDDSTQTEENLINKKKINKILNTIDPKRILKKVTPVSSSKDNSKKDTKTKSQTKEIPIENTPKYFHSFNEEQQSLLDCPVTPILRNQYKNFMKPKKINKSNNAIYRTTSLYAAQTSSIIYIKGKVVDINCVPISNANVELWHTDNNGVYFAERLVLDKSKKYDKNFPGSASAITDNLGDFNLITILPQPHHNLISTIRFYFSITHKDFIPSNTVFFIKNYSLNSQDPLYYSLDNFNRNLLESVLVSIDSQTKLPEKFYFMVKLVLNGVNPYRKY